MNTTYNPGDRVITKIKGQEIEVSVVKLSIDVEVKAPDGTVYWRAISKVRPADAEAHSIQFPPAQPSPEQPTAGESMFSVAQPEAQPMRVPPRRRKSKR